MNNSHPHRVRIPYDIAIATPWNLRLVGELQLGSMLRPAPRRAGALGESTVCQSNTQPIWPSTSPTTTHFCPAESAIGCTRSTWAKEPISNAMLGGDEDSPLYLTGARRIIAVIGSSGSGEP